MEPTAEPTEEPTVEPTEEPTKAPESSDEDDGEIPQMGDTSIGAMVYVAAMFAAAAVLLVSIRSGKRCR